MYGKDYVMNIRWIITFTILVDGGIHADLVNAHAFFWTGWATHFEMILPFVLFLATQPGFLSVLLRGFQEATF